MLFVWVMLAAVSSMGASAADCKKCGSNARNVSSDAIRNLLSPGSAIPTGSDRLFSLFHHRGCKLLPVQFNGATNRHSRITGEEWSDQRFKPFHLPQLLPVHLVGLRRTAGVGIEFDLSFQRGNRFPILFQGVLLDFGGDILKPFKFRQGQPSLKRISGAFNPLTALRDSINRSDQISPVPSIDQRAVIGNDKSGNLGLACVRHRIQRGADDSLQVFVHRCVKYAPAAALIQWTDRNCGTTTGHLIPESGSQHDGGLPIIQGATA
jgi:hypothetical protein